MLMDVLRRGIAQAMPKPPVPKLVQVGTEHKTHVHKARRQPHAVDVPISVMTHIHRNKYMPHQGEREIARRKMLG